MTLSLSRRRSLALTFFSCGTLNAAGAVLQSYSLGSALGACGFALIGGLGLYGKYQVLRGYAPSENKLLRAATSPTLTMSALASVSMVTGVQLTASMLASATPDLWQGVRAAGWFLGALGDIAQREVDHLNYSRGQEVVRPRGVFHTLTRAGAGPYYNLVSLCFTLAVGAAGAGSNLGFGFNWVQRAVTSAAVACFALGAGAACAPASSRLNRAGYALGMSGTLLLSGLSFVADMPLTGVAQLLFAASYMATHAENKRACHAKTSVEKTVFIKA